MADRSIPHWLVVVRTDQAQLFQRFRRDFERTPLVEVMIDRRQGPRRLEGTGPAGASPPGERRRTDRRRGTGVRGPSGPGMHRLVQCTAAYDVLEAESRVLVECPRCDLGLEIEMPRFGELPARLNMEVLHSLSVTHGVKHFVEAEAFRATGRSLLACRLLARPRADRPAHAAISIEGFAAALP